MSFELKPQTPISMVRKHSKADGILWTVPRDSLPPLLQGRVPLSVWTKTWDAVYERYEELFKMVKPYKYFIFIPCAAPCLMLKMIMDKRRFWDMWTQLAREQGEIYLKYNIQATVAKEIRGHGSGHFEPVPVGLRFDIGLVPVYPNANNPSPYTYTNGTTSPLYHGAQVPPLDTQDDMIAKLERLDQLHKTGALSDEEYKQAKAQLI